MYPASFLVGATLALSAAALPSELLPRADGYCNTSKNVQGRANGLVAKYPAISGGGSCILKDSALGAGVSTLQTALNRCYAAGLDVDGDFGPKTTAAVKKAQRAEGGLDVDGIWGPKVSRVFFFLFFLFFLLGAFFFLTFRADLTCKRLVPRWTGGGLEKRQAGRRQSGVAQRSTCNRSPWCFADLEIMHYYKVFADRTIRSDED